MGLEQFIHDAAEGGVDGLLVLDLPPEESDNYEALMRQAGLCHIYLVAPTTPEERMEFIVKRGSRFHLLHFARRRDGNATQVASNLAQQVAKIRAHTACPSPSASAFPRRNRPGLVARSADAVVVGSAIVNQIAEHGKSPELVAKVGAFVKSLAAR